MNIKIATALYLCTSLFSTLSSAMEPRAKDFVVSHKRRPSKSEETDQHKKVRSFDREVLRLSDDENRYLMQHLRQCITADPQTSQENIANLIRAFTIAIQKDRSPGSPLQLHYSRKTAPERTPLRTPSVVEQIKMYYTPASLYTPVAQQQLLPPQEQTSCNYQILEESEWSSL